MPSPWTTAPGDDARLAAARAHDAVVGERADAAGVRRLVEESWRRSLSLAVDPDRPLAGVDLDSDDLREYRDAHPLALALPTIHRLLIRHTFEAGLIVAVGDQDGRLLWIDGDRTLRRKAEGMMFVEGADWSESRVGTSAPGTALALDHGIQIHGPEHFNRIVHPWSCTAVPVHDPSSGGMLGVIDITGGDDAVSPTTLPLLEAAVAAVEAELRIRRLDEPVAPRRVIQRAVPRPDATLSVLGTEVGRLESRGRSVELSARHTEILALLAWHPSGLSAERLADLLGTSVSTLRPEMVRLRRAIEQVDASLVPLARPYRLPRRLDLDAHRVLAFLDRGAHRVALAGYSGQVLPVSTAPGIREIRDEVSTRVRESLLTDASVDTLLDYARTDEAAYDAEVWAAVLRMLPPKSPKRASVVARLERIEAELR
ncbi:GAF domain-containing protein [Salinibacterium soli]|uniref:Transcriptional regulator n=1 Tax=Antiquaquibacter soli TaxID=3064523 RepID=A0ABT9BLN6_9MICO|nr:GAF domain-containing protein [Protaetiibacter sp. WY-16]MDO7881363.1 transcriptional regulator [Protaetiibacter sp. WY-16]